MSRQIGLTVLLTAVIFITAINGQPGLADYSGALTSNTPNPGLNGTGSWVSPSFSTIGWVVSQNTNGTWHYVYALSVPTLDVGNFIIELPTYFTAADILNPTGTFTSYTVGTFDSSMFSGLPASIYGVNFATTQATNTEIAFDANVEPSFGNFYAQSSETETTTSYRTKQAGTTFDSVSNRGFTVPNDNTAARDGSYKNKVLVPNTNSSPIPDASTLVMASVGLLPLLFARKKIFG